MDDSAIEAYVDAVSQALDLTIAPEHRPGVTTNLRLILGQAARLDSLPLEIEDEAATVFRP